LIKSREQGDVAQGAPGFQQIKKGEERRTRCSRNGLQKDREQPRGTTRGKTRPLTQEGRSPEKGERFSSGGLKEGSEAAGERITLTGEEQEWKKKVLQKKKEKKPVTKNECNK